jgi:membrane protein
MPRGREAKAPTSIPTSGWLDIGWRVFLKNGENRIGLIAAGIAFYGLLAIFPGITAAVAIAGAVTDPGGLQQTMAPLLSMMPGGGREIVSEQIGAVASAGATTLTVAAVATLLIAFFSASKAVGAFNQGLNVIYEEDEKRNIVLLYAQNYGMTVALIVGLLLAMGFVAALPAALAFIGEGTAKTVVMVVRWPLLFLLGTLGIATLYRWGPSRSDARWRWLAPGAAVACVLWVAGSWAFSLYVQNFGAYNETFGALGGVIAMLTWLWLSAYVVLLGAQLDAEMEAQTKRDSTTGEPRPMGERGAVKADTLGERRGAGDERTA